jgi:hypothetical protein
VKNADESFLNRIEAWAAKFWVDCPIELYPYTEEELPTPLVQEALKKGITLFER